MWDFELKVQDCAADRLTRWRCRRERGRASPKRVAAHLRDDSLAAKAGRLFVVAAGRAGRPSGFSFAKHLISGMGTIMQEVPVNVTRYQDEVVTEQVPVTTQRMEQTEEVRQYPVTVSKPQTERVVNRIPVQKVSYEKEEHVRQIPVETRRIEYEDVEQPYEVKVCRMFKLISTRTFSGCQFLN